MLFDLRSPGRRRLIKTVYLFLAVLIGVGLVGFGVGTGGSFGGLFSAAANGGGSSGTAGKRIIATLAKTEKRAKANPSDATLWLKAGKAAYAVALLPDNYNSSLGYSAAGHIALNKMRAAWRHYIALAPANPNLLFAEQVAGAFSFPPSGVGDYPTAESAQEVVAENHPNAQNYEYLAYYAYKAGLITAGDQASARAIAVAPKKQVKTVTSTVQAIKSQVLGSTGASGPTGATGST